MDLVFICLYAAYAVLNILDGITTWVILRPDKFHLELNPVAKWIFIKLGIPQGIIITEMGVLSLLSLAIFFFAATHMTLMKIILSVAVIFFIWLVIDNFLIIRKLNRKRNMLKK